MTDEEIRLEYEAHLAYSGEPLKTCGQCNIRTHRKQCPECDSMLTGDSEVDEITRRAEAGEDVSALLDALDNEEFEPIKPGEMP